MTPPSSDTETELETGWILLDKGDADGAEACAEKAIKGEGDTIEALSLKAAVLSFRGDIMGAFSVCKDATALDPEDPRPFIQMAELALYSDDPENAIELAVEAIDYCGDEADFIDAILIKATAELDIENEEAARQSLTELDACTMDEAPLLFRAGHLWAELGEFERAQKLFEACVALNPSSADSHHALGMVHDERDDTAKATVAWTRALELDALEESPQWSLTDDEFKALAVQTIADLPALIADPIRDLPIIVEGAPSAAMVAEGVDPRLLGLLSNASPDDATAIEAVVLYKRNIERTASGPDEVAEEIRLAVVQEAADIFAISDSDLESLVNQVIKGPAD